MTALFNRTGQNDRPRRSAAGRLRGASVLVFTAWSLLGCYAYVPVTTTSGGRPPAVRVTLTTAGSTIVQPVLGANVREIEGVLVRSTPDSLEMTVEGTFTSTRERFVSSGSTVALARTSVELVQQRQMSRKRSFLLAFAAVALAALALAGISAGDSGASGTGQPGQPQP